MPHAAASPARLLPILQRLLEIPAGEMSTALTHACNAIADALSADKVDAFLHDENRDSLVAVGTSLQPLSDLQKRLGLDVLPVSNGGRAAEVFRTGEIHVSGNLLEDPGELRGLKEGLRVQSQIGIPLQVGPRRRGLVMIASLERDHFTEADVAFARSAVHWVGIIAERAELIEDIGRNALEQGRRAAADELVTVLAHDLRNYIAPVSMRLYMLRHRAERDGREEDLADAAGGLRAVNRLTALVSNLLDVARLDRGLFSLDVEPVDVVGLAKESAAVMATPGHRIAVEASDAVIVSGDPARLRQCIDNLLSNAISHSPKDAGVDVFISRVAHDGATWGRVEVIDQGPGIPPDILPHIFERFVTGRGKEGGLGVGLYLSRRIAAAHGGDLVAEADPGRGARFVLRLPLYD